MTLSLSFQLFVQRSSPIKFEWKSICPNLKQFTRLLWFRGRAGTSSTSVATPISTMPVQSTAFSSSFFIFFPGGAQVPCRCPAGARHAARDSTASRTISRRSRRPRPPPCFLWGSDTSNPMPSTFSNETNLPGDLWPLNFKAACKSSVCHSDVTCRWCLPKTRGGFEKNGGYDRINTRFR